MKQFSETALRNLARAACAMGRIIEAHADGDDCVRKVVVELSAPVQNPQIREAITQLWVDDGYITSVTQDGLLMIDGMRGVDNISGMDLVGAVSHQLKQYAMGASRDRATEDLTGSSQLAMIANELQSQELLGAN